MKPALKDLLCRSSLALLTLFGSTSSTSVLAADDIVQGSNQLRGNDGVGGIEKTPGYKPGKPQLPAGSAGGSLLPATPGGGNDPWTDLGAALAGSNGVPQLSGSGTGAAGSLATLQLTGALPGAAATLVLGTSSLGVPFKGGTLVPAPTLMLYGLPVAADGTIAMQLALPASLPAGFTIYAQLWWADGNVAQGFAASNGLALIIN